MTFISGKPPTALVLHRQRPSVWLRFARLASEAADNGLLDPLVASGIARVKGARQLGVRLDKWATGDEALELLREPDAKTLQG